MEIIGVEKYESTKLIIHFVSSSKSQLETKDRLAKWGMIKPSICQLCLQVNDDLDNLFCQCAYAVEVWRNILARRGVSRGILNWTDELQRTNKFMKGRSSMALVYKLAMASKVYYLWLECNLLLNC